MCGYTYAIYNCCDKPNEYDGIRVLTVEYCDNRPVSADGCLHSTDPRDCPFATGECLGESEVVCDGCVDEYFMEHDHDGIKREKHAIDDFVDSSDDDSEEE